jgi:hypothetical protein
MAFLDTYLRDFYAPTSANMGIYKITVTQIQVIVNADGFCLKFCTSNVAGKGLMPCIDFISSKA